MAFVDESKFSASEEKSFTAAQDIMKTRFSNIAGNLEDLRKRFFEVEKKCFNEGNNRCLIQHDECKLSIADIHRRQEKEKLKCFEACKSLAPEVDKNPRNMSETSDYFQCFSPFMERYLHLMQTECDAYRSATAQLQENY